MTTQAAFDARHVDLERRVNLEVRDQNGDRVERWQTVGVQYREESEFLTLNLGPTAAHSEQVLPDTITTVPDTGTWYRRAPESQGPQTLTSATYRRTRHDRVLRDKATDYFYLAGRMLLLTGSADPTATSSYFRFTGVDPLTPSLSGTFESGQGFLPRMLWLLRKETITNIVAPAKRSERQPNTLTLGRIRQGHGLLQLIASQLASANTWRASVQVLNSFGLGVQVSDDQQDFNLVDVETFGHTHEIGPSDWLDWRLKGFSEDVLTVNLRHQFAQIDVGDEIAGERVPEWYQEPEPIMYQTAAGGTTSDPAMALRIPQRTGPAVPTNIGAITVPGTAPSLAQAQAETALQRFRLAKTDIDFSSRIDITIPADVSLRVYERVQFQGKTYVVLEAHTTFGGTQQPKTRITGFEFRRIPIGPYR